MIEQINSSPRRSGSGISEAQGSGLRQKDAEETALEKLKAKAEDVIKQEKIKTAQTSSPLNLVKIRKAINRYRRAKGIE